MTLTEGARVKLVADTRLTEVAAVADGLPAPTGDVGAAWLSLAAGTGGTVEQVVEHRNESAEVREYVRLKSLLDDFGRDMPAESRRRLEEQVGSLEPHWTAFQRQPLRVTVRVRFDNGFVLDDTDATLFASSAAERA
ncbi:hypothetical protein [Streptomyces sp. NPDC091268]|uniref:hypothetical protein n=1 Tax=Streptomyces sp. NPDC091268 TaxID=3365979 RepID=UPI003807DCCE